MRANLYPRCRRRGSTILLIMVMLPLFLIPLVGLAIDGTMMYIVQAKLSAACDGAVLGAGRLLGTTANTTEIAGEFLQVNFPTGYWGANNLNKNITASSSLGTHTITVNATVQVPLLFLRILGQQYSTVAASATATRKDTRVVLILDRSGSMDTTESGTGVNVFTTLKTTAKTFVGMFTPGTDEMGLVAISGSSIVAYPTTRPYSTAVNAGGGPDTSFATSSTAGPMFTQINTMKAGGGTGMAEALSLAYIELQKAHYRDLAANGVDNALNSIVLFTDGVPTSIAVNPNDSTYNALKTTSPCTYNPETSAESSQMKGWIAVPGSPPFSGSSIGLYRLSAYYNTTTYTLNYWLTYPTKDQTTSDPSTAISGCSALGNGGTFTLTDLNKVPDYDIYGNSTSGSAYTYSNTVYNGTTYSPTKPTNAYHLGLAIWNATDNAGRTIRSQTAMNAITIYTIGYTGNGGIDKVLLKRLANTPDSTSYDPTQQVGKFIQVDSTTELSSAFSEVASDVLRLAQ